MFSVKELLIILYINLKEPERKKLYLSFTNCFNGFSYQERDKHIKNHIDYFKESELLCLNCNKIEKNRKKCIHIECPGLCQSCELTWLKGLNTHLCPACDLVQKLQCPICREVKPSRELCKGKNCHHYICYKCYVDADRFNRKIYNCPSCRKPF